MGCSNCSSEGGTPNGCKSNGNCGTGSCGKLSVFDWLADVELPNGQSPYDIVEVRFKNSRKGFYRNIKNYQLQVGDVVAVETSPGFDIGIVSVVGELARIQVRKKTSNFKAHEAKEIYRKATKEEIEKWKEYKQLESESMFTSRKLASELALQMKISDVEYQGDGSKATFYYTAEDRVDFRQLIRDLADEFKIKIEMKQIGVRQEAARLGGIGSCGRELCCSTWLTDFRSVSTASARYQQLSLNPQKLAGQCGKLKCCLNYELDAYLDALKHFPSSDVRLKTEKGIAYHVKTDVFKEQMWYVQDDKNNPGSSGFIPLSPDRVKEIIELNKEGKKPADLKDFMVEVEVEVPDYTDVVGQESLSRFEHVFKRKKKKKKRPANRNQPTANASQAAPGKNAPSNQRNKTTNPKSQSKSDADNRNKGSNKSRSKPRKKPNQGDTTGPKANATNEAVKPKPKRKGPNPKAREGGNKANKPNPTRNRKPKGNGAPNPKGEKPKNDTKSE
jgi:cell fate regulator YaaT (PSP1 superfamily)